MQYEHCATTSAEIPHAKILAPEGKERLFWSPGPLAKELRRLCHPMPVPFARGRCASHPEERGRQIPKH